MPEPISDAGALLLFLGLGLDAGVVDGLRGRRHGIDDERIDLALILDVHPFVGIELAVGIVAERNAVGDLAGDVIDLEIVDALGAALAGEDVGPGGFYAAPSGVTIPIPVTTTRRSSIDEPLPRLSRCRLSRRPW